MRLNIFTVLPGVVIISLLAFFLASVPTPYVEAQHGRSGSYSKYFFTHAYEEVIGTGTNVMQITPGIIRTAYPKTHRAFIKVTGQGIRFTVDGATTPSTDFGVPVIAGDWLQLIGLPDIQNFRFTNDDDTGTATCHIHLQYEKEMN